MKHESAGSTSKTSVTHQQIAEKLGISRSVVTLALHRTHRARISAETRGEILQAAHELGYRPRNLTTHTIAFVVDPQDVWWNQQAALLLVHADKALRRHGFRMTVVTVEPNDIASGKVMLDPKTVDGALFTEWYGARVRSLITPAVPWVLMADEDGDLEADVDQVAMDTVKTAANLTRYLCARGHQRICLLAGDVGVGFYGRLQRGLYQGLVESGLSPDNATVLAMGRCQQGHEEIKRKFLGAMKKKHPPTAIMSGNLGGVMLALSQLQRAGYRVPEDMSIVSCTDNPYFETLQPPITTTSAMGRDTVAKAVQRLIQKIKEPGATPKRVLIPGEIIERESVQYIGHNPLQG